MAVYGFLGLFSKVFSKNFLWSSISFGWWFLLILGTQRPFLGSSLAFFG